MYKINKSELNLLPKNEYKLIITKSDGNILTESSTKILTPLSDAKNEVTPPSLTGTLSFAYNSDFRVTWYPAENAVIHDVVLNINIVETINGITTPKTLKWTLASNFSDKTGASGSYTVIVKGKAFFQFLAGALTPYSSSNQVSRSLKDISLKIISGGQPIKNYLNIGLANIGITSSGEIPVYTNLTKDARGIFSSKTEYLRTGMTVNKLTQDSLRIPLFIIEFASANLVLIDPTDR